MWLSSKPVVYDIVPKVKRKKTVEPIDLATSQLLQAHAINVVWNTETDNLTFKFILKDKTVTKRGLLSLISPLYGLLGFLCLAVLRANNDIPE